MSKRGLTLAGMCLAIFIILCYRISSNIGNTKQTQADLGIIQDSNIEEQSKGQICISRAQVAKMLALLVYSHDEIQGIIYDNPYTDVEEGAWYAPYINATLLMGITWGEDTARPVDNITYNECREVLIGMLPEAVSKVEEFMAQVQNQKEGTTAVDGSEWLEIFEKLRRGELVADGVEKPCYREMLNEDVFLLSLIEGEGISWEVATSAGAYHFDGFALDAFKNSTINILSDGNEILYIYGASNAQTVLRNAWIMGSTQNELSVFFAGVTTTLTANEMYEVNTVADITVEQGRVSSALIKLDRRSDKILSVNETGIETQQNGTLLFEEDYTVYGLYDDVKALSNMDIHVGYSIADFVVNAEGTVSSVLVIDKLTPASIRVAIMTEGYKGYYHEKIKLQSETGMTMLLNGEATEIEAGKNMKFDMESELLLAGRVVLAPTEGGKITFTNLNRAGGAPSYRGTIELLRTDTGILVVNELSIDEYLYSVLPSEMPVSYGVEALKVQAVCARSYAYMQVMSNGLAKLGAHVDDSTSYQVYNNTPETAESIEAVNLTAGQVLTYEGDIVPAYYFSTSAGYTANGDEVWLGMKTVPYLQGKLQTTEGTELGEQSDLSNEENFSNFINNQDLVTFDSSFPWYRWNVTIAASDIKSSIENAIAKRYEVNPSLILTKGESGEYECKPITGIGKIKSIKVAKRSSGGIVTSVIVKGTEATIKILSEYNIRLLFAPINSRITRSDNSIVDNLALLPSAFFTIQTQGHGSNRTFTFSGGGYGHGVGMSQNGTRTMIESGYAYDQILRHYYSGCEVTQY